MVMLIIGYCTVVIVGFALLWRWFERRSFRNLPIHDYLVKNDDDTFDICDGRTGNVVKANIYCGYVP